jgi:hypothetical protein
MYMHMGMHIYMCMVHLYNDLYLQMDTPLRYI